jgi:hypothetical protein
MTTSVTAAKPVNAFVMVIVHDIRRPEGGKG